MLPPGTILTCTDDTLKDTSDFSQHAAEFYSSQQQLARDKCKQKMLILNFLKSQSATFAADTATVKVNQSRSFPQWLHDGTVIGSFTKALVEDTSFGAKFAKVACFHIAAWAGSKISSKFRPKMERGSCNAELVPFMAVRLGV